jgi:antitoxin (DNA-binding transcriptional repressor) of toxin-antitoxin stability system
VKVVGLRELKNRLSEYVRQAKGGEGVLVTDRGAVVAELGPPGRPAISGAVPPGLVELAARGAVSIGAPNDPAAYPALPPVLARGRLAGLLDEERGPR